METIADRIAAAERDAEQAAAAYLDASEDDPQKRYLGNVWSRAASDLRNLKNSTVPAR